MMGFRFSWSTIFSAIFLAYMAHSIYSLVSIFIPPKCQDAHCVKSFLTNKPKLQLVIGTTAKRSIRSVSDLTVVDKWAPFEYTQELISKNITIPLPRSTRRNGTLYMYAFAFPYTGSNEWEADAQSRQSMVAFIKLTEYLVPEAEPFNLLNTVKKEGSDENEGASKKPESAQKKDMTKTVAHIAKRMRLMMLVEPLVLPIKDLPMDIANLISFLSSDTYLPPMRFDKFGSRLKNFYKVNETEDTFELSLEFSPSSIGYLRLAQQFQAAMETMTTLGFSAKDLDEVKGIFSDTNIYLLAVTMFVASVHLIFDFLAFKNDISYWKSRKTTVGLSSRTTLWRCFSQIVVFLYLLEEKSSLLVLIPSAVGTAIEVWKVTKAFKVSVVFEKGIPRLKFGQLSETEKLTAQHDIESMRYLSYIMYPLCLGGAMYSLLYVPHKSWYSWTIQSLVYGVYSFGFLFMLPQLFVNYRLKSVAHLPWRAFMYKAFNTFIDDLFAFIITMPTAHRMACFRDDIVFLIYLYQRWLYPVDKTRLDAGGEFEVDVPDEQQKKTN
ncbi:unnamed protein product [Orchesella dallaii]|uniref:Lipid scramblase CLPTM1L n=1 Tax=Orchesella dallaii TaxID=48710 RepID=A0ABP1QGZ3_9HEXA